MAAEQFPCNHCVLVDLGTQGTSVDYFFLFANNVVGTRSNA
jgi:hypothetical protein